MQLLLPAELNISCLLSVQTAEVKQTLPAGAAASPDHINSALFGSISLDFPLWWGLRGANVCEYLTSHQQTPNCCKLTGLPLAG